MSHLLKHFFTVGTLVSGCALSALAYYPAPYLYQYPATPLPYPVYPAAQAPIATYSYTPQPAYEEVEVYVSVVTYEKRKAFRPAGVVLPGQLPHISTGQTPNISMSPGAVGVVPPK